MNEGLRKSRVCQEGRAGAKNPDDVSIAPLQLWQPGNCSPSSLGLCCWNWHIPGEINALGLCKTSLLLGRGVRVSVG